ncbi:methylmalonate-semialdehyde dehydrogenase (CoA acylating) [Bdellovibrio sp. ZAP7]|uniref:aldehyde dehydrogenase family protein n=1 Tax=Bdellovibrio sp. ZAP7 TaxID=2231053 RepID=UPI00115BFEC6|nr:aldehyde dehydrogenase family protein [Bdellovibrio sp. ZAP7]QDK46168.1 methylmalonate-semialdehyde dehydrogenase (CoA acylating) [Bdellovibrio sp. ZAP7]
MSVKIPLQPIPVLNFISGHFKAGNGFKQNIHSPHNGALIGEVHHSTKDDVQHAVQAAVIAQKKWAATPIKERSKVLFNLRQVLLRDLDEIAHLKSSESGKTFLEGKAGLLKGIEVLEFATSLQNLDIGGKLEVSRGVTCEYRRQALGVVASITPFNFPAMVPFWTIPTALALGNAYIWKPSEKTPLTSLKIAEAMSEAGLPEGVFQVLQGGIETSQALIDDPDIQAIAFVGSTPVARQVYQRGTQLGKRVLALGGAKNHIVLLPDAQPEIAGPGISDSFTGCAGQRCMAAAVLLAVGDVEIHIQKILERARSLELGKDMGALINKSQIKFLNQQIQKAVQEGAKILLDGRNAVPPLGQENGNWMGPTILDHVSPDQDIAKLELFGPVLCIIRCKDISEAMGIENSSKMGNACSVFTSSGALAEKVISMASTGMVGVNVGVPVPREPFSFGGIQESKFGHGDITGVSSLDFWSNLKKVTVKWDQQHDNNWMS